ncbi:hypothetical protein [uncultured Mediterranean phage]|nr:hypothetical protein [uncultured Mediterranean phage]
MCGHTRHLLGNDKIEPTSDGMCGCRIIPLDPYLGRGSYPHLLPLIYGYSRVVPRSAFLTVPISIQQCSHTLRCILIGSEGSKFLVVLGSMGETEILWSTPWHKNTILVASYTHPPPYAGGVASNVASGFQSKRRGR